MALRRRFLMFANGTLAALLSLFGCAKRTAPVDDPPPCLYGVPTADFIEIKGLVTDEQQKSLQSIEVVVKTGTGADTLHTDASGNFTDKFHPDFPYDTAEIHVKDPEGKHLPDTVAVGIEYKNPTGVWNQGTGTAFVNIILKKASDAKVDTQERVPMRHGTIERKRGGSPDVRPLYGVPPAQWQKLEEKENRKNISETKDKNE